MKNASLLLMVIVVGLSSFARAEQPPSDLPDQIIAKWTAGDIESLKSFLPTTISKYSNYVPVLVASAFYNFIFLGKTNSALATLISIQSSTSKHPDLYTSDFRSMLASSINELNTEIRIQTQAHASPSDWQANANPQAVRVAWGQNYHPLLDLMKTAPNIQVPQ